jgi:hypothetical protein
MNIGARSDPHGNPSRRVAHGVGAAQVPFVYSVGTTTAVLQEKRLAGFDGMSPVPYIRIEIVGMNDLGPAPVLQLFEGSPVNSIHCRFR